MQRVLSASKDGYITNKIINNRFRATDANVGQAGTLDLFKLYNESTLSTEVKPIENSRLLLKFDLAVIKEMHNAGSINVGDASFRSKLVLHDVYGGQTTPSNFNVIVFPLAKDFDEGSGFDISEYKDLGAANWITSSYPATSQTSQSTATLTILDGDDATTSNLPLEKETLVLTSTDNTVKTYVFVDAVKTSVATGDILTSTSDTGDNTAGSGLVGGIAVAINMTGTVSTQSAALNQLRIAILSTHGHNGKITASTAAAVSDGPKSVTLTQAILGYDGNTIPVNSLNGISSTEFVGGKGGSITWHNTGAMRSGSLGSPNIDVITSGTLAGQTSAIALCSEQLFITGEEDLNIDVTGFVSASVKNLITNHGLLVALSGSYETDSNSYFVKRFASRNTANSSLRPKLVIQYNDSIIDNHGNFVFDYSGSLYLNNFSRSTQSNIKNANNTDISPTGTMILKIRSGSFSKNFSVSQAVSSENRITGLYSASFALSSYDAGLTIALKSKNELEFDAIWSSANETITYLSSSLKVKKNLRTSLKYKERRLFATTLNLNDRYKETDFVRIRLFIENADREVVFTKGPIEKPSEIFENVHYSVKDAISGKILINFDTSNNSTKLSTDSDGMYYDFYMSSLPRGRSYVFEYLVKQGNTNTYITDAASKFIIE